VQLRDPHHNPKPVENSMQLISKKIKSLADVAGDKKFKYYVGDVLDNCIKSGSELNTKAGEDFFRRNIAKKLKRFSPAQIKLTKYKNGSRNRSQIPKNVAKSIPIQQKQQMVDPLFLESPVLDSKRLKVRSFIIGTSSKLLEFLDPIISFDN